MNSIEEKGIYEYKQLPFVTCIESQCDEKETEEIIETAMKEDFQEYLQNALRKEKELSSFMLREKD